MMNSKRGWLRIVEAVIGIMIIAGILLAIYARGVEVKDISEEVYELQIRVLEDVVVDEILRGQILENEGDTESSLEGFIVDENYFPAHLGFEIRVCEINAVCNVVSAPVDRDIYVEERIVSADLTQYSPKKVRLFVWEK